MTRTLTLTSAIAILVLTAGCGGSDQPRTEPDETSATTPTATASSATATPVPVTPKTPETSAPATTQAPSTLVDYGDDGIVIASRKDTSRLTGAPADFTSFVAAELDRQQATKDAVCTEKAVLRVERVDVRGWAAGGVSIPQCGGNGALWARSGGSWKTVWTDQTLPDCSILTRYRFPASVAGNECGTADGGTRRYPS